MEHEINGLGGSFASGKRGEEGTLPNASDCRDMRQGEKPNGHLPHSDFGS